MPQTSIDPATLTIRTARRADVRRIASLILMAGTVRRIHPTGAVMVHAPWTRAEGSADELRQWADALDTVAASMRAGYLATGQKPAVIEKWLSGPDFWFTAEDALAAGLVTEVIPADAAVVTEFANASACKHSIPETLKRTIMAHHQHNTTNEETVRAQALADDRQRRAEIRARFANWKDRDGVHALLQSCEDDPQCTVQAAGHRLLDLLGRNASPIQAGGGWSFGTGHDDRLADFRAAAVDTLLMRGGVKVAEPHPAALEQLARGLQTLGVRVATQNATAMLVAQWAASHTANDGPVRAVYYPGLATHPDRAVATACFSGHGNLISITLRGGDAAVSALLGRVQRFRVQHAEGAARLGGVESVASPLTDGSLRLSIGLDDASTLIGDLTQALE